MREILFKSKSIMSYNYKNVKKGDFVYGCFIQNNIDSPCIIFEDGDQIEIDVETLCQYSGLKDKNGVKVFENDIVTNDRQIKYVVSFENGSFILRHTVLKDIDGSFYKWGCLSRVYELDNFDIEVIGNIHTGGNHE